MNIGDRFAIRPEQESGFTLVELIVAMVITGIITLAIYSAHTIQQRVYLVQEQVTEMQQNIRAGLHMMKQELRMAGYDPSHTANAGVTVASVSQVGFTQDLDEDGGLLTVPGETVSYRLNGDGDGDGIVDGGGVSTLGRTTGAGVVFQPVAENIQAVEFRYLDSAGAVTAVPADIRSVQISILARAGQLDRKFTNTRTYTPASGVANNWGPYNDNFRRRLLITTVKCRNLGL